MERLGLIGYIIWFLIRQLGPWILAIVIIVWVARISPSRPLRIALYGFGILLAAVTLSSVIWFVLFIRSGNYAETEHECTSRTGDDRRWTVRGDSRVA